MPLAFIRSNPKLRTITAPNCYQLRSWAIVAFHTLTCSRGSASIVQNIIGSLIHDYKGRPSYHSWRCDLARDLQITFDIEFRGWACCANADVSVISEHHFVSIIDTKPDRTGAGFLIY